MLTAGVELINCRGNGCTFLRLLFLLQYQRNHLHPCKYSPLGQILHQQSQPRLVGTAGRNASSTLSNMPRWKIEHEQRDSTSTTASLSAVKRSIDSLLYHKLVKSRREAVVIGRILLRDYKLLRAIYHVSVSTTSGQPKQDFGDNSSLFYSFDHRVLHEHVLDVSKAAT